MRNPAYIIMLAGFVCLVTAETSTFKRSPDGPTKREHLVEAEEKGKLAVNLLDTDSDGQINRAEFTRLSEISTSDLLFDNEAITRLAQAYDFDLDGKWQEEDVEKTFLQVDHNKDGLLDLSEIRQEWLSLLQKTDVKQVD